MVCLVHVHFQLMAFDRFSFRRNSGQPEVVRGIGEMGAPGAAGIGSADAGVARVGVIRNAHPIHARIATGLEHTRYDVGVHHGRCALAESDLQREGGLALRVQLPIEHHLFLFVHGGSQIGEGELFISLEFRSSRFQGDRNARLQIARRRTVQPMRSKRDLARIIHCELVFFQSQQHFQAIGFHCFDPDRPVEFGAADGDLRAPIPGGCIG